MRVLVTGAGGAAAISFMRAVKEEGMELHAADMNPHAAGLYLVPPALRLCLPGGQEPSFVRRLLTECIERRIDILVPTVDAELLALARARHLFANRGIRLLLASEETLECLDKWTLLHLCRNWVALPRTELLDDSLLPTSWTYPVVVKPRIGNGSRGVKLVESAEELGRIQTAQEELIVQEYLPGQEYSVDVLADRDGIVHAVVPRERLKVDSGVAVASRTVLDGELMAAATRVAQAIGLQYVANVQFKRRANGTPALLEVNPRFPATMPLTVEAGINMPRLSLRLVQGLPIPANTGMFRETAVVRHLKEVFVDVSDLARWMTPECA